MPGLALNDRSGRGYLAVFICGLIVVLMAASGATYGQKMIVNPEVGVTAISTDEARLYITMRHKAWPNGLPVKVFVLPDDDLLHRQFANHILGMFPYQLRRVWDRQLYSGTGQAPITVTSEEEMMRRVAATPGAMGYVASLPASAPVRLLEVR
jgi:hypothetical protein